MTEQPLRAIAKREAVFPALDIPSRWFGETELTKRVVDGPMITLITEIIVHMFRLLPCGCRVTRPEQCGGVCVCCFAELEQQRQEGLISASVTREQQEWMATPCKEHYEICSFEMCNHGLCPTHAPPAPNGLLYCPAHIGVVTQELKLAELERDKGFLYAKGHDFIQGLFFDKYLRR